jgi:signal transduction histidine kinase
VLLGRRLRSSLDDPRAAVRVPLRIVLSLLAAALALWIVGALEPIIGIPVLFPSFVGIVFLSAKVAGTSYGLVTMALFAVGFAYFFQGPRGAFAWESPRTLVLLAAYGATGYVVARIGGALREAYARVRDEHRAAVTIHEQREDLLRALAHDVRSPLGVLTMNAALLTRDAEDAAAVRRRAGAIEKSAASVAGMLGDLVDTARLESGHLALDRRPLDLARFVVELKAHLEETLPLDRVALAVPEGLPPADVDPRRLERILENLLSNALKYAPSPTPVVLGAFGQGDEVVVSVADRGPGISGQDLPHIFEKYYRASGVRKKEGLGIGLYGTRLLVQAHGGRIWVESAPGQGATFFVALPAAAPSEQPTRAARAPLAGEPWPLGDPSARRSV